MSDSSPLCEMIAHVTAAYASVFPDTVLIPDSDFFDLGGGSLQALELVLHLERALDIEIHPASLLRNATIHELATALCKSNR